MENTDVFPGLHDFLERMRKPSAGDFVKSIKRFSYLSMRLLSKILVILKFPLTFLDLN